MRRAFLFNQEKCVACNVCTVACKDWNQVNPGPVRWRKQFTYETNVSPYFHPLAMSCNHCENPACITACAAGAIEKRPSDGIVYVDKTKCISLQACISACPFAAPHIADSQQEPTRYKGWQVDHPMQKCDFCMDRIDKGQRPACVDSCVANAIEMGDYDALIAKYGANNIVQMSPAGFPYAYVNNTTDTGPSLLIKKRAELIFTEDVDPNY